MENTLGLPSQQQNPKLWTKEETWKTENVGWGFEDDQIHTA